MQLTHIALWTNHLERLRDFYVKYFNGKSNEKYVNPKKGFASYFVSFESGPALEIMQRQDITEAYDKDHIGLAHLAFHADKKEQVDQMIERFRMDGYTIAGETRTSGDGYYEGVIRDPDGNIIEIVANGEPEIQVALFPPYELLLEADPDRENRGLPKGFGLLYRYGTKFRCRRDRGSQGGGWQGGDYEPCRGGYLPSARNRPETITACI